MRRAVACLTAGLFAGMASPASAAVTLGQLSPVLATQCAEVRDFVPLTVTSGNQYRVPGAGTITSWSTNGRPGLDQSLALKVYNRIADPDVYAVVGHDGPRPLSAAGGIQTFPANIPVGSGQVIGLSTPAGPSLPGCAFPAAGDALRVYEGNLGDGGVGNFALVEPDFRLNVTAVFTPSNSFTVGRTRANRKKGTATAELTVPNNGELAVTGKGVTGAVAASGAMAVMAGKVNVTIRAKGKKRKKLNAEGKVAVAPTLTYTPAGGTASTQTLKLKLRKKRKR